MPWRLPLRRTRSGTYQLSLSAQHRQLLQALTKQLLAVIAAQPDEPSLRRLAPPAYTSDPRAEQEYRRLMGADLEERRSRALGVLASTAGATELSAEQLDEWLRALNALRLWLGTLLDVSEDEGAEEPEDDWHAAYRFLTALQAYAIDALEGAR